MDSIDITDSAFSLGLPNASDVIYNSDGIGDYSVFIYIGAAIVVLFISMFVYKFCMNQKIDENRNEKTDCQGGFCNMNSCSPTAND